VVSPLCIVSPTPRPNTKRGARRARQNKTPLNVISMTQSEAFEASLARGGSDSCCIRGKFVGQISSLVSSPTPLLNINPLAFGARFASVASCFALYRIKEIIVKFVALGNVNYAALAFLDDATGTEGDQPPNFQAMLELRCSGSSFPGDTSATYFKYVPADAKKWYQVYAGASGSDPRNVNSAVLFGSAGINSSTTSIYYELDISVAYKGAVDGGAS